MARVSISAWLLPVEKCTGNKASRSYLSMTRFLWTILYTLVFVSYLAARFLKTGFFIHAFATSGNTTYFPVSLLISLSCLKGMFARSSFSYHVQLPENKGASRKKARRFAGEWINLRRIPSTVNKPSLSACSMCMHKTGNSPGKIGPISEICS